MIGTTTAGFRIITELGSGPTGEVFFAEQVSDGQRVAFKLLWPEACVSGPLLAEVLDEAREVGSLGAPGVVRVLSTGVLDDRAWIASEMVDGETVEERLERNKRIESREVADIGARVAEAVGAAHDAFRLHRGLKPSNVFLRNDGVTVTDFAITALLQEIELPLASLRYASPEQCRGEISLDHRTDVYSLGALLFHMITGRAPFDAEDSEHMLVAHATEAVRRPRDIRRSIPGWLEEVVLRAMAKNPDERFTSMQAMAAALREGLASPWDDAANRTQESEPPGTSTRSAARDGLRPEELTDEMEAPPDDRSEQTGQFQLLESSWPPLEEGERRVADKLARALLKRILAGRLDLPPAPEGVTAFVRVVTQPDGHADAPELLELDEGLKMLLGPSWGTTVVIARLARDIAAESEGAVDPRIAYLAAYVLAASRPLAAAGLIQTQVQLGQQNDARVGAAVRDEVVAACHREVAVTLTYAWQLPPEIAVALPSVGRGYGRAAAPLAHVLTAALESATTLD